jgi:uncharacterized protein (TIGR00251 family)
MAIKQTKSGLSLDVIVQPKSSRNEIAGMHGDRLKIKLTAPPVDGKANAALIAFLAKKLGITRSRITILRGETGRKKTLLIHSLSEEDIHALLLDNIVA